MSSTSVSHCSFCFFFFFNDTATTEIYTLSLHDALPICARWRYRPWAEAAARRGFGPRSEEHTSELQSPCNLVCRLLLEKKKKKNEHVSEASINLAQLSGTCMRHCANTRSVLACLCLRVSCFVSLSFSFFFFFFNDTATTEIYTLSLHDALPISSCGSTRALNRSIHTGSVT